MDMSRNHSGSFIKNMLETAKRSSENIPSVTMGEMSYLTYENGIFMEKEVITEENIV